MTQSSGSQNQNYQQQTVSQPWKPAQPALNNILSGIQGLNPNITPTEDAAIQQLTSNAGGIPNFGPAVANTATNYLSGDPYSIINPALSQVGASTQNLVDPNNLNPFNTPGFANALKTSDTDITNQINGQFAGAGRTGSGMDTQTLARGLSQGNSAAIAQQYNSNVSNLLNALQQRFGAATSANQALGQNVSAGATLGAAVPGLATQGPAALLSAGQAPFNLVAGNLAQQSGITTPIAALGGQTNTQGQQQTNTTNNASLASLLPGLFSGYAAGNSPIQGMGSALGGILSGLGGIFKTG